MSMGTHNFPVTPRPDATQGSNDTDRDAAKLDAFRLSVSKFTFTPPVTRSASRSATIKKEDTPQPVVSASQKRPLLRGDRLRERSPKKKVKRGYAPPETYAHLNALQDCLADMLDGAWYCSCPEHHRDCRESHSRSYPVVFCGIK